MQSLKKNKEFKRFIYGLNNYFNQKNLYIRKEDIAEVESHKHDVLQMLDLVLGAMTFKLNKKNLVKPTNSNIRGKKTRAKEKLYTYIRQRICQIAPNYRNFNVGATTGWHYGKKSSWIMSYRHWIFTPNESIYKSDP